MQLDLALVEVEVEVGGIYRGWKYLLGEKCRIRTFPAVVAAAGSMPGASPPSSSNILCI
jgi:hypothetical protein